MASDYYKMRTFKVKAYFDGVETEPTTITVLTKGFPKFDNGFVIFERPYFCENDETNESFTLAVNKEVVISITEDKHVTTNNIVVAAAIQFTEQNGDKVTVSKPSPARHADIIHSCVKTLNMDRPIVGCQGFLDSSGTFLTRQEAATLVLQNGQKRISKKLKDIPEPMLFTEDLW